MRSIDLVHEDQVVDHLGKNQLTALVKAYRVAIVAMPFGRFYRFSDYMDMKAHHRRELAAGRKSAGTVTRIGTAHDRALRESVSAAPQAIDPYPVDLETAVDEIKGLPKVELLGMARQLDLRGQQVKRKEDIAKAIVAERAHRWYAKQGAPMPDGATQVEMRFSDGK